MKRSTVLWRFRRSPLRRRSYLLEGWALLALGVAATLGAALAGLAVTSDVDARYAQQRHDRHPVTAVLVEDADVAPIYAAPAWTRVRRVLPGGQSRTGRARVSRRGERTTIWLDGRGRPAAKPLSPPAAWIGATVTGSVAGLGICGGALIAGRITAASLESRRLGRWESEWAQVGPQGNHRTA